MKFRNIAATAAFTAAVGSALALGQTATASAAPAPKQDFEMCVNYQVDSALGFWTRYNDDGGYIGWTNESCWPLNAVRPAP